MCKGIFHLSSSPMRGLFLIEKAVLVYLVFTLVLLFFLHTEMPHVAEALVLRAKVIVAMVAMWGIYRLAPCDATMFLRVAVQLLFLVSWYPDTFEFNCCFNNLDHVFCSLEASLFGCQPSIEFSRILSGKFAAELFALGYASFYPIIALTVLYYFLCRRRDFLAASAIVMLSFLIYFVIFIFLPVAGPTFYFQAVGIDVVEQGVYPMLGNYFATHADLHLDCLPTPGWSDGVMWNIVESAKAIGERPTAAFPSSHVGMSVVCACLLWRESKVLFFVVLPFVVLMFFATVYIQAHYAIDAIAGLLSGFLIYYILWKMIGRKKSPAKL